MILVFDIGGTKTRYALSDGKTIGELTILPTLPNYKEGLSLFTKIKEEYSPEAVVGGFPGPFNKDKSVLRAAPHLADWAGKSIKQDLERIFGKDVYLENDAALAGLGEATMGAGKGYEIIAYMTISTGVGGARIVKGAIDQNAYGFEIGHQIIEATTNRELESFISGSALGVEFHTPSFEINDTAVWSRERHFIASAVQNMIVFWSPDVVILGGAIMKRDDIQVDKIQLSLQKTLTIFKDHPPVKKAELGDAAALWGALYLFQNLKK